MIIYKNWIINSALSSVIAVTCVVADKKMQSISEPLTKALIDNSTHAMVGLLSAVIVFIDQLDKIHFVVVCAVVSSLIDSDHFVMAKSLKLSDATNLLSRPFFHNSTIPLVLICILLYCHITSKSPIFVLWLIALIIAFVTHHLRDANRRGLWFAPFGNTPALSTAAYILLILTLPYLIKQFVPETLKYARLKTTVIDV